MTNCKPHPIHKKFGKCPTLLSALVIYLALAGCSSVNILNPQNGATFPAGQAIQFEGEVTRSSETGGADRSDDLSWTSNVNGNLGTGRTLSVTTLNVGPHNITASWPGHNRSDSINIQVNP
ncbi:MAG: hypothetical protein R3B74_01455 [Nitrospirales bacterium]|nr:hypothetical protein [Nitrospirales bacterium]